MDRPDPLQRACARLVDFLLRRRAAVLAVSVIVCVVLAATAARLRLSTDWAEPLLPRSHAELKWYASALHRFGDTEMLYVDVVADSTEALHKAAEEVESRMRASGLFRRVLGRMSEWDLQRTAQAVGAAAPALLDDEGLRDVERRTRPEALAGLMEEHYERLLGPVGGIWQDVLSRDPLGLAAAVLEHATGAGSTSGARMEEGRIVSQDGRHALVLGLAQARVGDEVGAAAIEAFFAGLEYDLGLHPAKLRWIGGHRHYLANSLALQRDMTWISVLAVALVLGVIFVGFRGARITWISAVAVAVGSLVGAAALALAGDPVSGIAIGFGAALSGISVDYVIHLHAPRRRAERRVDAVRRVFVTVGPSVVIGAITSAAGFFVLLASDIPAHRQLGLAAGAGILGALAFALFPGPLLAAGGRRDAPVPRDDPANAFERCATATFAWILRRPGMAFAVGAVLVGVGAASVPALRFESDVRKFEVRDKAVDEAQEALATTWGDFFSQQLVVVPGPDVQAVLERTDVLSAALRPLVGVEFSGLASTTSVMPAVATQERRLAAWREFWTRERREQVRRDLAAAASAYRIKASTFDPFFASLDASPEPLVPERLAGTPLETIVERHLSIREGDVLGLVVLTGARRQEAAWPDRVRSAVPEARILSGRGLADAVVEATRREFAALALPALILVWLLLVAYYRSLVLASLGVFPLIGGLLVTAGILFACGEHVTLLNAAVALPVFGLGVDYAVFLIDAMRDAARHAPQDRDRRIAEVGERMGTMIGDVLTTLAGAIAMLFASTPAIFTIGLAMTAGVGGAMLVAWLMVPQAMIWARAAPR